MGGTEIRQALLAAVQVPGPAISHDVLLITDGEVWENSEIINMAKRSGHRFFTIGVGSSVSEGFVRHLAKETSGACELVAPREKMAEKITRQFQRIYLPRAEEIAVRWPMEPKRIISNDIGPVYDGDTLHVFACFSEKPSGSIILDITLSDGRAFSQNAVLPDGENTITTNDCPGTITRLAIHQELADKNETEAMQLAVRYQIISPYTNYLIVSARVEGEKVQELPMLRKVPQMLAAGWGGTGSVLMESRIDYAGGVTRLRVAETELCVGPKEITPGDFIGYCNRLHTKWPRPVQKLTSYNDLLSYDLPEWIITALKTIAAKYDPEVPEETIVLAFLQVLAQSGIGWKFSRNTKRATEQPSSIRRGVLKPVD